MRTSFLEEDKLSEHVNIVSIILDFEVRSSPMEVMASRCIFDVDRNI